VFCPCPRPVVTDAAVNDGDAEAEMRNEASAAAGDCPTRDAAGDGVRLSRPRCGLLDVK